MGCPEIESTDHIEGIAPVPKRVRLDPRRPGKIIAVPDLLKSNSREPNAQGRRGRVKLPGKHRRPPVEHALAVDLTR